MDEIVYEKVEHMDGDTFQFHRTNTSFEQVASPWPPFVVTLVVTLVRQWKYVTITTFDKVYILHFFAQLLLLTNAAASPRAGQLGIEVAHKPTAMQQPDFHLTCKQQNFNSSHQFQLSFNSCDQLQPTHHQDSRGCLFECFYFIGGVHAIGWFSIRPMSSCLCFPHMVSQTSVCNIFVKLPPLKIPSWGQPKECCACTRVLCMHKNLAHAQESWA